MFNLHKLDWMLNTKECFDNSWKRVKTSFWVVCRKVIYESFHTDPYVWAGPPARPIVGMVEQVGGLQVPVYRAEHECDYEHNERHRFTALDQERENTRSEWELHITFYSDQFCFVLTHKFIM